MVQVVCIGGACIDRKYHVLQEARSGTSNPARARRSFGGVARNVAENLARLNVSVAILSVVGMDENGIALIEHANRLGIDTSLVFHDSNHVTPEYGAVLSPRGDLLIGIADMEAIEALALADVEKHREAFAGAQWMFVDCNVSGEILAWCIGRARSSGMKLAIDAVSEPKACRLPEDLTGVDLLLLNEKEAAVYLCEDVDEFSSCTPADRAQAVRSCGASAVLLTRGSQGLIAATADASVELPALSAACVDETGAGDALIAATIYRLIAGDSLVEAARTGSLAAGLTVEAASSVRADLSATFLEAQKHRLEACAAS